MSTRDEALTAVLNAARVLLATVDLPRTSGTPYGTVAVHLLIALRNAVDAVDAVGAGEAVAPERMGLCQMPECWRYADVGVTCYHHSRWGTLTTARPRDAVCD